MISRVSEDCLNRDSCDCRIDMIGGGPLFPCEVVSGVRPLNSHSRFFGEKIRGYDELIDRGPSKSQVINQVINNEVINRVINKGEFRVGVIEKRRVCGPDEEGYDARHVVGIFCPVLESATWTT